MLQLKPSFSTVSGKPLTIGTGTGTKWKELNTSNHRLLVDQLKLAMDKGFYHIDTAEYYQTQPEVGVAIKEQGVDRKDLWITTKYGPMSLTSGPLEFMDIALKELQTDYVDLLLIHVDKFEKFSKNGHDAKSAWEEFVQIKKAGKARYIGVSNFSIESLQKVIDVGKKYGDDYLPVVNQIEFHPYLKNQFPGLVKYCQDNDILVEAYGPLSPLLRVKDEVHPLKTLLPKLGEKYNKTEAQLLLRYTLQKNILPVTTSANPTRIEQSLEIFDFNIDDDDFKAIDSVEDEFQFRAFDFVI